MKLFLTGFVIFSFILMTCKTPSARAQLSPSLEPAASVEIIPQATVQVTPNASISSNEAATPEPSAKVDISPVLPTFPPLILPIFTEPTPMPLPSTTPRPTLPILFQVYSSPTPIPSFREVPSFEIMTYRSIVAPALSFVSQTNVEEFYRDQRLPERTANLLYAISLGLIAIGVWLSSQRLILETVYKLKRKELVQYGN